MAISSNDSPVSVRTSRLAVPAGATNALLVDNFGFSGCVSTYLKYFSGGTCEILGVASGVTYNAATLAALSGTGYLFGALEVVPLAGPVRFYLSSTGATSVVMMIQGIDQPG